MNTTSKVLPASLQFIKDKLAAEKELSPAEMRQIVLNANVKVEDLMPWADYDHPVADSYGRKLIHHGGHFELMVMSWAPGDFSAIHDHGYTQWGAVQVFGPAEHATFRIKDGHLTTLARWVFEPGDVVGVNHSLIHQMGNPSTTDRFLTLHVYGQKENIDSITGDARVFTIDKEVIQRVDGGVFFALPSEEIKLNQDSPKIDFATRLRHMLELTKRLLKMENSGSPCAEYNLNEVIESTFSKTHLDQFLASEEQSSHNKTLRREVAEAGVVQDRLLKAGYKGKHFDAYSKFYETTNQRFAILDNLN